MSVSRLAQKAMANPLQLAAGAALIIGVLYYIARRTVGEVAEGVGGTFTGNNPVTKGTAYAGKGIVGTVAAAADKTSGGALSSIGEAIGGWLYEATHTEYDPNTGLQHKGDTLTKGAANTNNLWGSLGAVQLRSQ